MVREDSTSIERIGEREWDEEDENKDVHSCTYKS